MKKLVDEAKEYLKEAKKNFESDLTPLIQFANGQIENIPTEIVWQRYTPLRVAAKNTLFSNNPILFKYANEVFEDYEPITLEEGISYALIGVLIAVSIFLPWAIAIVVDVVGALTALYLTAAENEEREKRNRFISVDAALEIASPTTELTEELAFLAISYLIPVGIGTGFRIGRKKILELIAKRAKAGSKEIASKQSTKTARELLERPNTNSRSNAQRMVGNDSTSKPSGRGIFGKTKVPSGKADPDLKN